MRVSSFEDVSGLQLLQEKILYSCTVVVCRCSYLVAIPEVVLVPVYSGAFTGM